MTLWIGWSAFVGRTTERVPHETLDRFDGGELRRLLDALADRDVEVTREPTLLQYDDPWTPPFMRTNEVEAPVLGPGATNQ